MERRSLSEAVEKFEVNERKEKGKVLVRDKDRMYANDKSGKEVKIMAVEDKEAKKMSLHLKYSDGDLLATSPLTKGSVGDFQKLIKKDYTSLHIDNEK